MAGVPEDVLEAALVLRACARRQDWRELSEDRVLKDDAVQRVLAHMSAAGAGACAGRGDALMAGRCARRSSARERMPAWNCERVRVGCVLS